MALSSYLHEYAARAAGALGGDIEASITVREYGLTLRAGSSTESAARCDQAEAMADQGPCIEAMELDAIQVVRSIDEESRWVSWRDQASDERFVRALAVPAQVGPDVAIALNLYSRTSGDWTTSLVETARAYAGLVASGVRLHLQFADLEDAAAGVYRAMSDAVALEWAAGAIMETNDCSEEVAREVLRSASRHRGVSERMIAEQILRSLVLGGRGDIVDERER